ncbi:Uncharacterised protein [Bordetella pertussis]|nr:Uncharacterised protein [Bordetella pertussis]
MISTQMICLPFIQVKPELPARCNSMRAFFR